jgi:hypothetical protein
MSCVGISGSALQALWSAAACCRFSTASLLAPQRVELTPHGGGSTMGVDLKVGATNARPASWPERERQQAAALQSAPYQISLSPN